MAGRYIQSDPIGLLGGASTYGYADQSPGKNADHRGLSPALAFLDPTFPHPTVGLPFPGSCGSGLPMPNRMNGASFEAACKKHDDCYGSRCIGKDTCDLTFYRDMVNACGGKIGCNIGAVAYYMAVHFVGGGAYNDAQRRAR